MLTTKLAIKTNVNKSHNGEHTKKDSGLSASPVEHGAMSPLQRFNHNRRLKHRNEEDPSPKASPKFQTQTINKDLPASSYYTLSQNDDNKHIMTEISRTRSISNSSPRAQPQKVPKKTTRSHGQFVMVKVNDE